MHHYSDVAEFRGRQIRPIGVQYQPSDLTESVLQPLESDNELPNGHVSFGLSSILPVAGYTIFTINSDQFEDTAKLS
jgi:hypothetical protein